MRHVGGHWKRQDLCYGAHHSAPQHPDADHESQQDPSPAVASGNGGLLPQQRC